MCWHSAKPDAGALGVWSSRQRLSVTAHRPYIK